MIWRNPNVFSKAMNFLVACAFLLLGTLLLVLPWVAHVRTDFVDTLAGNPIAMTLIGISFLAVGALLMVSHVRHRYHNYHIRTGQYSVTVDSGVLNGYVDAYWRKVFPDQSVTSDVKVHSDTLHIIANLPPYPFEEQKALLLRIEKDLAELFAQTIDYRKSFLISMSFRKE